MSARRGLSLVELLVAVALATMISGATVSFLRSAREAMERKGPVIEREELERMADLLLAQPGRLGFDRLPPSGVVSIGGTGDASSLVRFAILDGSERGYEWLTVRAGDHITFRRFRRTSDGMEER